MPLTPEQFNKLALKSDIDRIEHKIEQDCLSKQDFLELADVIMKKLENIEESFVFNQAAHDRMSEEIASVKTEVKNINLKVKKFETV